MAEGPPGCGGPGRWGVGSDAGDRFDEATMEVRHRGYELLQQYDPEYFVAFKRLYADVTFSRTDSALSRRFRELIMVAVCAATGRNLGIRVHTRRALRAGAAPREILEALQTTAIPCGMPVLWAGLEVLAEELKAAGRAFE